MRTAVVWNLLALLGLCTLVHGHTLGRLSSTSDLAQLKSLLERFEETLAEVAQEENPDADYDGTNQGPDQDKAGQPWSLDQAANQEPLKSGRFQSPAEGHSNAARQKSRLQDLLMSARASSCFGARMDRIGNASGLGCNNGRG